MNNKPFVVYTRVSTRDNHGNLLGDGPNKSKIKSPFRLFVTWRNMMLCCLFYALIMTFVIGSVLIGGHIVKWVGK